MTGGSPVVGVNLTWLVPGVVGGSEEYTVRLLEAVPEALGAEVRLRLYGRSDLATAHPGLVERHEFVVAPSPPGGRAGRVAVEHSWLAARTRHDRAVHHAGGTVPLLSPVPTAVTVHDLQPIDHPDNFSALKRHWLHRMIPHAVRASRLVLCPSTHTADRLEAVLGVPRPRIRVVPHGYGTVGGAGPEPGTPAEIDALSVPVGAGGGPGPSGPYLLYPAIAYPHKRHLDVVALLDRLRDRHPELSVVFTGRPGPETPAVIAEVARLGLDRRVHHLGRVPMADLERLYRGAEALVFPSAYEGFGNPAVEAMRLGCPVVASDAGALPEVVGSAGLVVPVGDVDGLAWAVARILEEPGLAESMAERGRERATRFDLAIAAARLAEVYRELVEPVPAEPVPLAPAPAPAPDPAPPPPPPPIEHRGQPRPDRPRHPSGCRAPAPVLPPLSSRSACRHRRGHD